MSTWKANARLFSELGITAAKIERASWAGHTCDITVDGRDADAAGLFAAGATVTILNSRSATPRFVGEVQGPARRAEGGSEGQSYRLVNAWIVLEETIYEQPWVTNSGTVNKARCIVGLKASGVVGTLAEAVADVLSFAGIAAGSITLAVTEEPWEVRNVTCAEVLRQIARLVPRAVSWWTYPSGVPTFNVATAPSSVTLAFTPDTDSVDLRPNPQQAVRGVRLQYEVVSKVGDTEYTDVVLDTAGATTGRRILLQTIPWRGAGATFVQMDTTSRTIPTEIRDDADAQHIIDLKKTRQFWSERCPKLRAATKVSGDADLTPSLTFYPFDPAATLYPAALPDGAMGYGPVDGSGNYYFAVKLARIDGTSALTATISNASPAVVTTASAHGLVLGNIVVFTTTGTLPAPLVVGTPYYVLSAGLTATTFEVSLTAGGAAINTTTGGAGVHTVGSGGYELSDPDDASSTKTWLTPTLTRWLVKGEVTPWMVTQGKVAQRWVIYANISYFDAENHTPLRDKVSVNLTATNCLTRRYSSQTGYSSGDPVPSGLAAALYTALGQTWHEGTVTRTEEECSNFAREGNALLISGGAGEWASMNALVQSVSENLGTGTTSLVVGVGTHLGPGDMLDLIRRERKRREADTMLGVMNAASKGDGLL